MNLSTMAAVIGLLAAYDIAVPIGQKRGYSKPPGSARNNRAIRKKERQRKKGKYC
jgi:hypothetical protein